MPGVFIDSAPLIYLAEGDEVRREAVESQLYRWIKAEIRLGTSTMTLLELLVAPMKNRESRLERKYRSLMATFIPEPLIPLDSEVAVLAASYRAKFGLRTPDAVQLASAVSRGYETFYTNDQKLLQFPDIEVVLVDSK